MGGTINNMNYIRNKRTWGTISTVDMDSIHAKDCYHLFERQGLNGKGCGRHLALAYLVIADQKREKPQQIWLIGSSSVPVP
jgi:hypothetical protein